MIGPQETWSAAKENAERLPPSLAELNVVTDSVSKLSSSIRACNRLKTSSPSTPLGYKDPHRYSSLATPGPSGRCVRPSVGHQGDRCPRALATTPTLCQMHVRFESGGRGTPNTYQYASIDQNTWRDLIAGRWAEMGLRRTGSRRSGAGSGSETRWLFGATSAKRCSIPHGIWKACLPTARIPE